MDTLQTESTLEDHSLIITDVRFRPNSTQLATSSFDTTVRLWDAAEVNSFLPLLSNVVNIMVLLLLLFMVLHFFSQLKAWIVTEI